MCPFTNCVAAYSLPLESKNFLLQSFIFSLLVSNQVNIRFGDHCRQTYGDSAVFVFSSKWIDGIEHDLIEHGRPSMPDEIVGF